jgi:ADP-heptose:LPS heptosyltransferase
MMARPEFDAIRNTQAPIVFFMNAYGDHLLTRPSMLALQHFFRGRLGFIGAAGMADMFFPDLRFRVSRSIPFQGEFAFDAERFVELRGEFDAIINLNWWDSENMRAIHSLIPDVPAIQLCKFYGIFTTFDAGTHVADSLFQLPALLDPSLAIESFSQFYPIDGRLRHLFDHFKSKVAHGRKVLGVHTLTKPHKQWPVERFKELLARFLLANDDFVALVVDPMDRGLEPEGMGDRVFLLNEADLTTTSAFIALCDAFVGIDSYFLHVADLARVPTVGIFGPTAPSQWGCRFTRHVHVVEADVASIAVDSVLAALSGLVDASQGVREVA